MKYLKVIVGSKNEAKVSAVREVFADYTCFGNLEIIGFAVSSEISEQPLSLEETIQGAKNRALNAYRSNCLSVGLEGGLTEIPESNREWMHLSVCSIFDGEKHHLGMSCGFRIPKMISELIIEEGLDLNQAMNRGGLTEDPQIGASIGAVGVLTCGRINRKQYCKQSVTTALISLEQPQFFESVPATTQ